MIQQKDAARTTAIRRTQSADEDSIRTAMHRVRARVSCARGYFLGFDYFDNLELPWIRFGVDYIDARGAKPGGDQITPLDVRMWSVRTQRRAAGVPAEVMQFVSSVRHINTAHRAP